MRARGKEAVLNYKDKFPEGVAVWDIERGKASGIRQHYWQTDTSVSVSWLGLGLGLGLGVRVSPNLTLTLTR